MRRRDHRSALARATGEIMFTDTVPNQQAANGKGTFGVSYYENKSSLGSRLRDRRFHQFLLPLIQAISDERGQVRILDLGGTAGYWKPLEATPLARHCHVTVSNLTAQRAHMLGGGLVRIEFMQGDAR